MAKSNFHKHIIEDCTCGRKRYDLRDLASILEEHKTVFGSIKKVHSNGTWATIVCLRKGCKGKWRTHMRYIDKVPLIPLSRYYTAKLENKNIEQKDLLENPGRS